MLTLDQASTKKRAVFGYETKVYIGANNNATPDKELEVDGVSSAIMPFSLISDDGGLALYEVIDIEINFSPQTSGDFSDTISIESNAQMYYPTFIVDLPGPQMIPPQPKFIINLVHSIDHD